jgi:hypothetical protein
MADVINTTTLEMRASVNEGLPPYDAPPWLVITREQYNLWSVIPPRYRKWVIDHVEEMTQPEKDAVDAAFLEALRDQTVQQLDRVEDILRAFMLMVLEEFNRHTARTNALLTAIDNAASLAALKTAVGQINDLPTHTAADLRAAIRLKLGQ